MKNKIYAISLLLTFLAVLSHELIVHHHHEDLVINLVNYEYDDGHSKEQHHHHDSKDEKKRAGHDHLPFPPHNHISATHGFDYIRITTFETKLQVRKITSFIAERLFFMKFSNPPNLKAYPLLELQFFISSIFNPDANALRGPPPIV